MNPIQAAIEKVGSASALARAIEVTPQAVCFWRDGLRKIPAEKCTAVERATGGAVTRKDLRPDDWQRIWPELVESEPSKNGEPAKEGEPTEEGAHG